MRRRIALWASWIVVCVVVPTGPVSARDLFESDVQFGANSGATGTNSLLRLPVLFDVESITALFPGYTEDQDFSAVLDLRGLPATLDWDGGAQQLTFAVPGIPPIRFDANDLDSTVREFKKWFEGDFEDPAASQKLLTRFLQKLVQESPVDPVAGNPNSLMSKMTRADWVLGGEGPFLAGSERIERAPDQTGIAYDLGYARADGLDVQSDDLHFDHRFNLRGYPRLSILVSVPLTVTWTNRQWALMGSVGAGVQYRVTDRWSLTPMVRFGLAGSIDVGAGAFLYSGTLTSHVELPIADWVDAFAGIRMGVTNQFGIAETADGIQIGDYEIDYDLTNYVLRNGAYLSGSLAPDMPWAWKVFGGHSEWFGDQLYLESSAEIGVALLRMRALDGVPYAFLDFNIAYLGDFGRYDGFRAGARIRF